MYATIDEARAAGALGTDAEVTDALASARVLVDRFTRQWWEPTAASFSVRVSRDGFVPLPRRVVTVDSVTAEGAASALAASTYVVREHSLQLRSWGGDPLVVGAEPWRGGYASLTSSLRRVLVAGTFGFETVDPLVRLAAARLAAWLTTNGQTPQSSVVDADVEGNALTITVGDDGVLREPIRRTTGLREVDELLSQLTTSGPVLIS